MTASSQWQDMNSSRVISVITGHLGIEIKLLYINTVFVQSGRKEIKQQTEEQKWGGKAHKGFFDLDNLTP